MLVSGVNSSLWSCRCFCVFMTCSVFWCVFRSPALWSRLNERHKTSRVSSSQAACWPTAGHNKWGRTPRTGSKAACVFTGSDICNLCDVCVCDVSLSLQCGENQSAAGRHHSHLPAVQEGQSRETWVHKHKSQCCFFSVQMLLIILNVFESSHLCVQVCRTTRSRSTNLTSKLTEHSFYRRHRHRN